MKNRIISPSLLSADFSKLKEQIDVVVDAGATRLHLDKKYINSFKIRIPPIEIQRVILSKIVPKEKLIKNLEKNIKCAEKEAKDIMQVLFN